MTKIKALRTAKQETLLGVAAGVGRRNSSTAKAVLLLAALGAQGAQLGSFCPGRNKEVVYFPRVASVSGVCS